MNWWGKLKICIFFREINENVLFAKFTEDGSCSEENLSHIIRTNPILNSPVVKTPGSLDNRFLKEDIPFALVPWFSIARNYAVPLPAVNSLIRLASLIQLPSFTISLPRISNHGRWKHKIPDSRQGWSSSSTSSFRFSGMEDKTAWQLLSQISRRICDDWIKLHIIIIGEMQSNLGLANRSR